MNYTQFRLTNGDEIVAEVIQEPEGEELYIVVRNAMMILRAENIEKGFRYYSFRPWMSYQINDEYFQLLNYTHIVGEAKPDPTLLGQFKKALDLQIDSELADKESEEMSAEEEINALRTMVRNGQMVADSDGDNNVIRVMFDKEKLH